MHLILANEDGVRATLRDVHCCYIRMVNFRQDWRGHPFQCRFVSYPMDGAHLMATMCYVENKFVAPKMVGRDASTPPVVS